MKHTKGKLKLTAYLLFSDEKPPRLVANISTLNFSREEWLSNAHRLADCWNGCKDIENPMAVKDVVEALKQCVAYFEIHTISRTGIFAKEVAIQALSNLGGK